MWDLNYRLIFLFRGGNKLTKHIWQVHKLYLNISQSSQIFALLTIASFISSEPACLSKYWRCVLKTNHSSQVWHIQTVMRKGIKFVLVHHQSFWTAAAVRLFMINDSMILLFISISCMLMMWFNVPLLFKDFLLDIHPSWPDFFHPELKPELLVKRFNVANPGGLKVFTFSRLTDINQDQIIYFVQVNIGYRGGYWLKGQWHAHFCLNLKLVKKIHRVFIQTMCYISIFLISELFWNF